MNSGKKIPSNKWRPTEPVIHQGGSTYLITNLPARNGLAYCDDLTRAFEARVRACAIRQRVQTLSLDCVGVVEGRGFHLDEDLVVINHRIVHLLNLENLGAARVRDHHRLHIDLAAKSDAVWQDKVANLQQHCRRPTEDSHFKPDRADPIQTSPIWVTRSINQTQLNEPES